MSGISLATLLDDPSILLAYAQEEETSVEPESDELPEDDVGSTPAVEAGTAQPPNAGASDSGARGLENSSGGPSSAPDLTSLTRKQKQRLKHRHSEKYREKRKEERASESKARLNERIQRDAAIAPGISHFESLATSAKGFTGASTRAARNLLNRLSKEKDPDYYGEVLQGLEAYPYDPQSQGPTKLLDPSGALHGLRPFRHREMTSEFNERLMRSVDALATAVKLKVPSQAHTRGGFAQILMGYKHGMGNAKNFPYHSKWDRKHQAAIDAFTQSDEVQLIIQHVTELMQKYFPGVAEICERNKEFWLKQTDGKTTMEFGLFFNLAINVDMEGAPVKSIPHRDSKNLAFGVCVIIPIGYFPSGYRAWLVNLEANIVIELPPLVPYYCLSSVMTHYNADRAEFLVGNNQVELVTTANWEVPNSFNTTPLSTMGTGRGSLVFYNAGSSFHWLISGHQYMADAVAEFGSVEALAKQVRGEAYKALQILS